MKSPQPQDFQIDEMPTMSAVYQSRLDPWLRHLAATLAYFADASVADNGETEAWPEITQVTQAMGIGESAVREGVQALLEIGVLVPDGCHDHKRQFRFDLARLATYEPLGARTRSAWRKSISHGSKTT